MAARLTPAEAKALGLDAKPGRTKTTGKRARAPYHSVCATDGCGKEFKTEAAEERHLKETHHARYQLVLDLKGTE